MVGVILILEGFCTLLTSGIPGTHAPGFGVDGYHWQKDLERIANPEGSFLICLTLFRTCLCYLVLRMHTVHAFVSKPGGV